MNQYRSLFFCCLIAFCGTATAGLTVTLEDLSLSAESFNNGNPGGAAAPAMNNGTFVSNGATFNNNWNLFDFGGGPIEFWDGWAYSNRTDVTTPGFGNQYSAYVPSAPGGSGGSANYGVSFGDGAFVQIPPGEEFSSIEITNTTYAALSMRDGDGFAKQFGGPSGNDPDFYRLTITGLAGGGMGAVVGTVDFFLADFRFANNAQDYIVDAWTTVDLSSLTGADTLSFAYASSDTSGGFINQPTYFAADNLITVSAVPEPGAFGMLLLLGLVANRRRRRVTREA